MLPHREPAWKIIAERLDVLTTTCTELAREPGLSALGDLAAKLGSMHEDVRKHLDERASAASGSA